MKNQTFKQKFKNGCLISELSNSTGPIVVGFSGGSDSAALLFSVNLEFASKRKIIAVHINHGLRGKDSSDDAGHAKSFCSSRNIIFHEESVQLPSNSSLGLEADARNLRIIVFEKYLKKYNSRALVLGHHLNDNAETILMRLFEGSGLKGLSGIRLNSTRSFVDSRNRKRGESDYTIFRPMLNIKKEQIIEFCKSNKISFVEDKTNKDKTRFRNNIRHSVLPLLTKSLGEHVVGNIVDSAKNINEALILHDEVLDKYIQDHVVFDEFAIKICSLSEMRKLSLPIRSGIIKHALEIGMEINVGVKKSRLPIKKYIKSVDALIQSEKPSSRVNLGKGVEVRREYDEIIIEKLEERKKIEKSFPLQIGGMTKLEDFQMCLVTNLIKNSNLDDNFNKSDMNNSIILDFDSISNEQQIVVRTRMDGDKFYPLNSTGNKKLKKYFIDLKVPLTQRDEIPLLAIGSEIILIFNLNGTPGIFEYSDNYQITENTRKFVKITANKMKIN